MTDRQNWTWQNWVARCLATTWCILMVLAGITFVVWFVFMIGWQAALIAVAFVGVIVGLGELGHWINKNLP